VASSLPKCWTNSKVTYVRIFERSYRTEQPEAQAFRLAVSRLGDTDSVSTEFKKVEQHIVYIAKIGALLWAGTSTALVIGLLVGFFPGKLSLLLIAHILTLTAGYSAAF